MNSKEGEGATSNPLSSHKEDKVTTYYMEIVPIHLQLCKH